MSRRGGCWLVAFALVATAATARAQAWDDFTVERFRLAIDGNGLLDVDWADVPGHKSWGVGLWASFARDPLVLYDRTMDDANAGSLVEQRVTTGLTAWVSLWKRLELGVGFQAVGYQASGSMVDGVMGLDGLASAGAGDVRLAPKLLLVGGGRSRVHVAVIPAATVPVGSAEGFFREAGPTLAPELVISAGYQLRASLNAGYRYRATKVEIADLVVGDEIFARGGIGARLGGTPEDPTAEVALTGSFAMAAKNGQANERSIEALGGGSVRVTRGVRVFAAGGVGLDRGFGTPDFRALAGVRVQSVRGDRDLDGIEDLADRCSGEPEDRDGFEDGDGCPELDNDGDGIADAQDKAPGQSEDKDGFEDTDGVPDLDNDADGLADTGDTCPDEAEDKDGVRDDDGCPDRSGKLAGKVVDAEGRAIPAAQVVVEQPDHAGTAPITLTTADDGTFATEVHAGTVTVKVTANGYTPHEAPATLAEGVTADVPVTLARVARQGQIRGQVLSYAGKPLAATVTISGATSKEVTTDRDGYFVVDLPEGKFSIAVDAPGMKPQQRSVEVKIDRVTVVNVDMQKGGTARPKVRRKKRK